MTERIKIPHPHGALMMEYAKECLIDVEAWRNWEFTYDGVNWVSIDKSPCWYTDCYYRRKPKKVIRKFINGIEVPMHLTEKPTVGEYYYSVTRFGGIDEFRWRSDSIDTSLYSIDNCYATEEDAQANLDAMRKYELREAEE